MELTAGGEKMGDRKVKRERTERRGGQRVERRRERGQREKLKN